MSYFELHPIDTNGDPLRNCPPVEESPRRLNTQYEGSTRYAASLSQEVHSTFLAAMQRQRSEGNFPAAATTPQNPIVVVSQGVAGVRTNVKLETISNLNNPHQLRETLATIKQYLQADGHGRIHSGEVYLAVGAAILKSIRSDAPRALHGEFSRLLEAPATEPSPREALRELLGSMLSEDQFQVIDELATRVSGLPEPIWEYSSGASLAREPQMMPIETALNQLEQGFHELALGALETKTLGTAADFGEKDALNSRKPALRRAEDGSYFVELTVSYLDEIEKITLHLGNSLSSESAGVELSLNAQPGQRSSRIEVPEEVMAKIREASSQQGGASLTICLHHQDQRVEVFAVDGVHNNTWGFQAYER